MTPVPQRRRIQLHHRPANRRWRLLAQGGAGNWLAWAR